MVRVMNNNVFAVPLAIPCAIFVCSLMRPFTKPTSSSDLCQRTVPGNALVGESLAILTNGCGFCREKVYFLFAVLMIMAGSITKKSFLFIVFIYGVLTGCTFRCLFL